MKQLI